MSPMLGPLPSRISRSLTLFKHGSTLPEERFFRTRSPFFDRPFLTSVIFLNRQESSTLQVDINGEPSELQPGTTVSELLKQLDMLPRYVAVERNSELVPRADHQSCVLEPGDRLEIVTLVGGG